MLPGFVDGKDNLDSYLLRFERYAIVAGWRRSDWATWLSPLLSGRALDVYSGLADEQAMDYDRLQKALGSLRWNLQVEGINRGGSRGMWGMHSLPPAIFHNAMDK